MFMVIYSMFFQSELVKWFLPPVPDGCWPVCSHSNGS